jgi:hypothetical protein
MKKQHGHGSGAARFFAALALAVGGCGGAHGEDDPAAGKPTAAGGEQGYVTSASTEARPGPLPGAARPARADDLSLRTFGASPIGPLLEENRADYVIHVAVQNASPDPIILGSLRLHASVYRNELLVDGCGAEPAALVQGAPDVIGPGATMVLAQPMPCALTEPGDYEVISVVMVGAPTDAAPGIDPALRFHRWASAPLTVDADLPPYRADQTATPR